MRKTIQLSAIAIALLVLGACSSSGGLGDILGGGGSSSNNYGTLRGTVDFVDTANRSVVLTNVSNNSSMLSSGGPGNSVRVYYDNSTSVDYQGQSYRPEDLERGDQVDVRVNQNGNQLYATSMSVVYNARAGSSGTTYPGNGTYGSTFHGVVRSVDTSRGTVTIDRGYNGGYATVNISTNTPVYFNNRTYRPGDLEVGDEVDVRMNGNSVQDITVTRSISSSGTYGNSSSSYSTIRGTVRFVDTAKHTIQLDSPSWISGFNRGSGTMGNTIYVSYDPNMSISVNGQMHPISGLERGDVIDVQVSGNGTTNLFARSIMLVRDVRQ